MITENRRWTGAGRLEVSCPSQTHWVIFSSRQEIWFTPLPICFWFLPRHAPWWHLPSLFPLCRLSLGCSVLFPVVLWNSKNSQNSCIAWTAQCASRPGSAFGFYSCWVFFLFFFSPKSYNSLISLSCYQVLSSTLITLKSQTVMGKKIYFII